MTAQLTQNLEITQYPIKSLAILSLKIHKNTAKMCVNLENRTYIATGVSCLFIVEKYSST